MKALNDLTFTVVDEYFKQFDEGLIIEDDPPIEAYEAMFIALALDWKRLKCQLGDLAVGLRKQFGEQVYEIMAAKYLSERSARTVEDWAYVCRNVPLMNRLRHLSFSHYRVVAKIEDHDEQLSWLTQAMENGWSSRILREKIGGEEPTPRYNDRLFEIEQENAELHRKIDNLIRQRDQVYNILNEAILLIGDSEIGAIIKRALSILQ